jgi:dimethylargininase
MAFRIKYPSRTVRLFSTFSPFGSFQYALARDIDRRLPDEALRINRSSVDLQKARIQHRTLVDTLRSVGVCVEELPSDGFPDSVFIEDTAVIIGNKAFISKPGAESRRAETDRVKKALHSDKYHGVVESVVCQSGGTLDGGDVLFTGIIIPHYYF